MKPIKFAAPSRAGKPRSTHIALLAVIAGSVIAVVFAFGAAVMGAAPSDEPPSQILSRIDPAPPGPHLEGDPQAIEDGKKLFGVYCSRCHGIQGHGGIGPPFTDLETLHITGYEDIVRVVYHGVPGRPMMAWKQMLTALRVRQVAAFVFSLHGTRPGKNNSPRYTLMTIFPAR